ncbi:MAG: ATP-binding protein [Bacteroidales bacterium]
MLQITQDFINKVAEGILAKRDNYSGSDSDFARSLGINQAIFNRIKKGEREKLLAEAKWLSIGRELGISLSERKWNPAKTEVFKVIEEEVIFCKEFSKSRIFVDDCGIGKSYTAKYLSNSLKNCFYVDCSQAKSKRELIRTLAKAIGVDDKGKLSEIKANTKYYLRLLPKPIIIMDEAGDLDYGAFLELKEYWNATDGYCGWYLMGADGLREKMERGIRNKKVGFAEIFSRYSERYGNIVPAERNDKISFYRKLITDVLSVNMDDKDLMNKIVLRCLTADEQGHIGGLRRAESLLILNQ